MKRKKLPKKIGAPITCRSRKRNRHGWFPELRRHNGGIKACLEGNGWLFVGDLARCQMAKRMASRAGTPAWIVRPCVERYHAHPYGCVVQASLNLLDLGDVLAEALAVTPIRFWHRGESHDQKRVQWGEWIGPTRSYQTVGKRPSRWTWV